MVAGLSGSLEGDSRSKGPSPREDRGQLESSVNCKCRAQPPVSETLGTGISSMASLQSDNKSTQSCSGVPLSQWGLQNAGNKRGSPPDKVGQLHHGVQSNTIDCRVVGLLRGDRSSKGGQGTMRLLRCNCRDTVSSKVNVRDGQVWLAYRVTLGLISQVVGYIYPRAECLISGTYGLSDRRVTGQVQF